MAGGGHGDAGREMITPIGKKVAVERLLGEEHKGKIIIPEPYRFDSQWVRIHSVGKEVTLVKPGDTALIPEKYGQHMKTVVLDGKTITIVSEDDIQAILEQR